MKVSLPARVACAAVMCVSVGSTRAQTADEHAWQQPGRPFRVAATVDKLPSTGLEGDDIAVATFCATGRIHPDGRTIRVGVAGGGLTPHRVLQVGPGDLVRVALALRGGARRYFIYFGGSDPGPPKPESALDIRRGVLMETFAYHGGKIDTLKAAEAALDKATRKLGCDFRPNIFIGHNPFGPQNTLCSRFTAYLKTPRDGDYTLIISSRNASFLRVDGRLVISNGGWHRPQRDYSKRTTLPLSAGLHKVEMLHLTTTATPIIVLAWLPDGRRRAQPIPEAAFAPVARAKVGPIEQHRRNVVADFDIRHGGTAHAGLTGEYHRMVFRERLAEQGVAATSLQWDFGDGQTATGAVVEHVYLHAGQYRVKLTAQTPAGSRERVHRVYVARQWDRPRKPFDAAIGYGAIVRTYDFTALSDRAIAAASMLVEDLREDAIVLELAEVIAGRQRADNTAQSTVLRAAARVYRRQGRSDQTAALLSRAIAQSSNPLTAASLRTLLGEITLADLNDPDGALAIFEQVVAARVAAANPGVARSARIGIGDVWRRKGDYARAHTAYEAAMPSFQRPTDEALRRGVRGRDVEAFLHTGDYDRAVATLDAWEWQLPVDRLTGQTTLLRARLHAAQRQWERVVSVAEALVKVNPDSAYGPQLLLQAAEAYLRLGQIATAKGALRRLVEQYPESALADQAHRRMSGDR